MASAIETNSAPSNNGNISFKIILIYYSNRVFIFKFSEYRKHCYSNRKPKYYSEHTNESRKSGKINFI